MYQSAMRFERNSNDPADGQLEGSVHYPEVDPENDIYTNSDPDNGTRIAEGEEGSRCQEQVRALKERLRALKEVILEPRAHPLEDHETLSAPTRHDAYYIRVQDLERRVGEILLFGPGGDSAQWQDTIAHRGGAVANCDWLSHQINHEDGYLSQENSIEPGLLAELEEEWENARAQADDETLSDESEEFGENQLDSSESQSVGIGEPEDAEGAASQKERQEIRTGQWVHDGPRPRPTTTLNEECEAQLLLVRVERDSAIQQNEEARRALATRTAERNGAHQRMNILETAVKESQAREALLQLEISRQERQEQTQANLPETENNTCEAERKEIAFLQEELEHAVAAAAKAQHERDTARADVKALEEKFHNANSAAEIAEDVVVELQQSVEAAKHAALAEREKSEESRRTQNRLRIERETVRIEVARLEKELSAAHQISKGLVRHGNVTVGDLVHIREEKDAALARLAVLQSDLDKANATAQELQMALNDCLARHANGPADDLALDELNRVIRQRDEALARVRELERLLNELEDDYRKNLDQWERQTQRDEQEIGASRRRLAEEEKRQKELSEQLHASKTQLETAEARARAAEERAENAEITTEALQIQNAQLEQDLDHSSEDREELEGIRDRLRAECLRLGSTVTTIRNEVIRLGGTIVAPDGTLQDEDGCPRGPPYPGPDPSNVPRPPLAKPVPLPDDPDLGKYNPFPYSVKRQSVAKSLPSTRISSLSSSRSSLSSLSGASESATSRRRSDGSEAVQSPDSPPASPLSSPGTKHPARAPARDSSSPPPLYTSPTMSTQTSPRRTRNPEPNYGAASRSRSRKRAPAPNSEQLGALKKRRLG